MSLSSAVILLSFLVCLASALKHLMSLKNDSRTRNYALTLLLVAVLVLTPILTCLNSKKMNARLSRVEALRTAIRDVQIKVVYVFENSTSSESRYLAAVRAYADLSSDNEKYRFSFGDSFLLTRRSPSDLEAVVPYTLESTDLIGRDVSSLYGIKVMGVTHFPPLDEVIRDSKAVHLTIVLSINGKEAFTYRVDSDARDMLLPGKGLRIDVREPFRNLEETTTHQ